MHQSFVSLLISICISLSRCPELLADSSVATRPSDLAFEIEALRALDDLQATPSQFDELRDASTGASAESTDAAQLADIDEINHAATGERAYYVTLLRLRQGLLKGDAASIEQGEKELSGLEEKLQISFAPRITPSEAAQRAAAGVVGQFSGRQIAAYLAQRSEEISDPAEVLLAALTQCRGMDPADFQQFNRDVSQQVADLVAGMARRAQHSIATRTSNLLKKAHGLKDAAFDDARPGLEQQAREITHVDPSTALRNWMEYEIAQLLSNPQLLSAISDRFLWAGPMLSNSSGDE